MRGALEEEEEDEDDGVLGSVLLHSPLLVEGISANTSKRRHSHRSPGVQHFLLNKKVSRAVKNAVHSVLTQLCETKLEMRSH